MWALVRKTYNLVKRENIRSVGTSKTQRQCGATIKLYPICWNVPKIHSPAPMIILKKPLTPLWTAKYSINSYINRTIDGTVKIKSETKTWQRHLFRRFIQKLNWILKSQRHLFSKLQLESESHSATYWYSLQHSCETKF